MNNSKNYKKTDTSPYKRIDLVNVAINQFGFTHDKSKSTQNLTALWSGGEVKSGDLFLFGKNDTGEHFYVNKFNDHDKGDIFNFLEIRLQEDSFKKLVEYAENLEYIPKQEPSSKSNLQHQQANKPSADLTLEPLRDVGLLMQRGISKEAISSPSFFGKVFNKKGDINHLNDHILFTAWPITDIKGNIVSAEMKGIDPKTDQSIKTCPRHSEKSKGIFFSKYKKVENLFISETSLDSMSYAQLRGPDPNTLYTATVGGISGSQLEIFESIVKKNLPRILLGCDNGMSGTYFNMLLVNRLLPFYSKELRLKYSQMGSDSATGKFQYSLQLTTKRNNELINQNVLKLEHEFRQFMKMSTPEYVDGSMNYKFLLSAEKTSPVFDDVSKFIFENLMPTQMMARESPVAKDWNEELKKKNNLDSNKEIRF